MRTQVRGGVYGMSWEPWPPARYTSARAAWRPQNLNDGAMKKLLVGAAAIGCRRGPSGAGKTEITDEDALKALLKLNSKRQGLQSGWQADVAP